jgi:hypothetical protein
MDPTVQIDQLCGVALKDFNDVEYCFCGQGGACTSACGNNLCTVGTSTVACNSCINSATGCLNQLNQCTAH